MPDFDSRSVQVGWSATHRLITDLSRADIARYAGVSGDLNRVHIDEPYAIHNGLQSAIAHGMHTMALAGSLVSGLVGHDSVRRFGGRFVAPVHPGDSLDCRVSALSVARSSDHVEVILEVRTTKVADSSTVFLGEATVVI